MKYFALTTAATFIASMATGTSAVALNDWFGSGDLLPYSVFSAAFAVVAASASVFGYGWTKRLKVWIAALFAFIFGILFGFVGTFAVAIFLGPWMGAMSVPVLQSWCMATAFTFSASVLLRRLPFSRSLLLGFVGLALACVIGALGFEPAVSLASGNQQLTVYFYRHVPGDTELDLSEAIQDLDDSDIDILRQTGLRGKLESRGYSASNTTKWPRAKALLIFTGPSADEAMLRQPKHCTVAYVQDSVGFRRVPKDGPTFERSMRIEPGPSGQYLVVEHASGAQSSVRIDP